MAKPPLDLAKLHLETRLMLAGRNAARYEGAVNPPIHRATTLLVDDADALYGAANKTYAIDGMAVHEALQQALLAVEGGVQATLTPTGLAACTLALMSVAKPGGELLVTDALYAPTRRFCETTLKQFGVSTRYIDPRIGAAVGDLIHESTCGVFIESPGSVTFEFADVPAICGVARTRNIPVILDNTWSAGVYFKPFEHGADISVQALTKYQSGHADAFAGAVIAGTSQWAARVHAAYKQLGLFTSPDDCSLILRGLRTLPLRLERQRAAALVLAQWLETRPEIARVLHPALQSHPDHAVWRRDFSGASGVFGVVLHPTPRPKLKAMLEGLSIFAMGFSWGGYESLIVPSENIRRDAVRLDLEGPLLRLSIGLEHPDDLIGDLTQALARLA